MEADAITVHAVKMLDSVYGIRQIARAIWALVSEPLADKPFILFPINFNRPVLADLATQFVKKHADQLVRHVRLGPPSSRTQFENWIFHPSLPPQGGA
jgi:hypothetical protein